MALKSFRRTLTAQLTHFSCGLPALTRERRKIVPDADGVVVEIGIGTGRNLPYYDPAKVRRLIGVNPADGLTDIIDFDRLAPGIEVEIVLESAENMSLDSNLADTVLVTYTLCSIPDVRAAITEIRRVLKPAGKLLFCEHGRADDPATARWQDRLDPLWSRLAQGCHINRMPADLLEEGGFQMHESARYSLQRVPSLIGYHHTGMAFPR